MADYTTILSRRLVEVSDGAMDPVLVHAGQTPSEVIEVDFPVVDISGMRSATALADTVQVLTSEANGEAVVLLEYSGYGYAKRGVPLWLARGLSRVCGHEGVPLITMFHEISASGPIWTSAFWLSSVQTYVARWIARLSDGCMATHPKGARQLEQGIDDPPPTKVCPVFSNVGEPNDRPSLKSRPARAVIFGGDRTKRALYDTHRATTERCLNRWQITSVVDVGPSEAVVSDAWDIEVEVWGVQSADTISELLLDARIGLLQYPAAYATKSGVLAAYMAHGLVPVLVDPSPLGGGLTVGTHFAAAETVGDKMGGAQIAQTAAEWYDRQAHSRRAADTVLDFVETAIPTFSASSPGVS